jgi:arsenate reductase-like glutaredoxin family protein
MCSQVKKTLTFLRSLKIKIGNHKYLKIIINFKMTVIPIYFPLIYSM